MPAFLVPSTTVVEIRVRGLAFSQAIFNRFHYADLPGGGTPSDSGGLLDDFIAMWRAAFIPLLTANYRVVQYELRTLVGWTPSTSPPLYKALYAQEDLRAGVIANDTGTAPGDAAPTYVALSYNKDTAMIGRRWVGGFRLATIPENQVDGNTLLGAYLATAEAAGVTFSTTTLAAPGSTATWKPVVFSLLSAFQGQPAGNQATTPVHTRQVLACYPSTIVGSQLSRKERNQFGG